MFNYQLQKGRQFEELTGIQYGWGFTVTQLGPSETESLVGLYQTQRVAYNKFQYGAAYDQRLHAKQGILSFGLLDPDSPATWAHDRLIPNDGITVFPNDDVPPHQKTSNYSLRPMCSGPTLRVKKISATGAPWP